MCLERKSHTCQAWNISEKFINYKSRHELKHVYNFHLKLFPISGDFTKHFPKFGLNVCIYVLIFRTLGRVLCSKFASSGAKFGSSEAKCENAQSVCCKYLSIRATFQLSVCYTYVHARKSFNSSKQFVFNK